METVGEMLQNTKTNPTYGEKVKELLEELTDKEEARKIEEIKKEKFLQLLNYNKTQLETLRRFIIENSYENGENDEVGTNETGNPEEEIKKLEREGWSEVYIFTKMLSLGYIPKTHDMKWNNTFKGQKIKWVWDNSRYLVLGGPLTNGTVNNPIIENNKNIKDFLSRIVVGEETQLRTLLNSVKGVNTTGGNINKQLEALDELKKAIEFGDETKIKTASENYTKISEQTNIKQIFIDIESGKEQAKKTALEKSLKNDRDDIIFKLNTQIEAEQTKIINLTNTTILDNELFNLNQEKETLDSQKETLDSQKETLDSQKVALNKEFDTYQLQLSTENKKKGGPNPNEVTRINSVLTRLSGEITNKQTEIDTKKREIDTKKREIDTKKREIDTKKREIIKLPETNKQLIETAEKQKIFLEGLRETTTNGDHEKTKELLKNYRRKTGANFKIDPLLNHETFITTDQNAKIAGEIKTSLKSTTPGELKDVINKEKITAIETEKSNIINEIQKIEAEIDDIRKEAEKKLEELDKTATRDPSKIPELRAEIESTVGKMNQQIGELEKRGVEKLNLLNPEELKLLTVKSKWTQRIATANGWVDGRMSGIGGKVIGVGAILLLAKGVYDGVGKDGLLTEETGKNIADIGFGMIPIAGGAYDLWRAWEGTDLNGREMDNVERWTRAGFGVIGLIPLVGTVVKWSATAKKGADVVKLAQKGDLITERGQLTGKIAGIGMLGYGGITNAAYMLPN